MMISIDLDVLLRYLLFDEIEKSAKAAELICGSHLVFISDAVLIDTAWTLSGKQYHLSIGEIAETLEFLFQEPNIRFEDLNKVWREIGDYRNSVKLFGTHG